MFSHFLSFNFVLCFSSGVLYLCLDCRFVRGKKCFILNIENWSGEDQKQSILITKYINYKNVKIAFGKQKL